MTDAEKIAERLEAGAFDFNADGPCWPGDDMAEAAAFIRKLAADNERLKMENVTLKMHIVNDRFLKAAPNV
jgi:hypothetical protein